MNSILHPELNLDSGRTPWIEFLFITVVFFIAQHDVFYSLREFFLTTSDIQVKVTVEGTLGRRIVFPLLAIFGVIGLMRKGGNIIKINGTLGWFILFYLIWAFSSIAWADNVIFTFKKLIVFGSSCVAALAVSKRFSSRDLILFAVFTSSLYLIIGLSAELLLHTFHPLTASYRFAGTLHPNGQAVNCAVLFLAIISFVKTSGRKYRLIFIAAALFALVFLILTKSRTGILCTILAFLVYCNSVLSTSRKFALVLCVSCALAFVFLLFGESFLQRALEIVMLGRTGPDVFTLNNRTILWEELLNYWELRPFLGYGYDSFWTPRHINQVGCLGPWGFATAHSAYLDILLGLGIIGMVTYVFILIFGIMRSYIHYKSSQNPAYAFMMLLLVLCSSDGLLESQLTKATFLAFLSMVSLARLGFQVEKVQRVVKQ